METRECQNCHSKFTIEPDDFSFYEKIKVPPPTWCPECRMIRRLSCNNGWYLYYRNCDKCGERTLSMYPPEQKITVYCQPCWWGDSWDGTEYGMDYDSNKTFFKQLKELSEKTPYCALETTYLTLKNCSYCNGIAYSKNCTLAYWADHCEDVCFSSFLNELKFSSDCIRGYFSELCYESVGFSRCYKTFYSDECDDCIDVWFSRNCYNCQNCIGCVNLSGASYCIFNVKYNKKEYEEKLKDLGLESWSKIKELKEKAFKFWQTLPYRAYHGHSLNYNVTGDYVYTSKNSKESYILNGAENCKWCQLVTVSPIKDCYDYSGWGNNAQLLYECFNVGDNVSNCKFSGFCFPDVMNVEYCLWNISAKDNFGCVNLKRKQYCILNKEYKKEEYFSLKNKIIKDMKENPFIDELGRVWSYGDFFQPGFSKLAYNNSNAYRFFPKTKKQALDLGYYWNDGIRQDITETIKAESLPEEIKNVTTSILNEIISCINCEKKYKIIEQEFNLLKRMNLPIPHECPKCRENKRFDRMTLPRLYDRNCDKCGIEVRTPYSSDRPEIIYCEKCYQQEVY